MKIVNTLVLKINTKKGGPAKIPLLNMKKQILRTSCFVVSLEPQHAQYHQQSY